MELSWITAILVIALTYLLYWWLKKKANYWTEQGIPHDKYVPLIGSMKDVLLKKITFAQLLTDKYKQFEGEKYFGFHIFTRPVLVIRDVELINLILIKDFAYFSDRNPPMNENLELFNSTVASITGDKWKVLRHKMTPTFTSGKMKAMFKKMKECSEEAMSVLKKKNGQDIDSRDFLFKYMINVIADVAIGIKADAFNEEKENENLFLQNSKNLFTPTRKTLITMLFLFSAPKLKDFLKLKLVDKRVNDFFQKLVDDLIEHRRKSDEKRTDFLQLMLDEKQKENNILSSACKGNVDQQVNSKDENEAEDLELMEHLKNVKYDKSFKVFSDRIIAAQTLIFVSGGTETTAATLSFALYELAVNKDIQERAQHQIDFILETQDFDYEAVKKMVYLDQILNEVLRLRTPGSVLTRLCLKDYRIPGTDIVIKQGTQINIPVLGIHKDPQYFPDPEKFDPDRFQNMDAVPKGVFFPFGGGPRICIAMRLAMLKMKVFLAKLLSHYNVVLSEKTRTPIKLDPTSVLQHVEGGLWFRFEPRLNKQ